MSQYSICAAATRSGLPSTELRSENLIRGLSFERLRKSLWPVAQWALDQASKLGAAHRISVELIDLKTWARPLFDLAKSPSQRNCEDRLRQRWAEAIARADGYLFVIPSTTTATRRLRVVRCGRTVCIA